MDLYQVYNLPPPHPPTGFTRNYGPGRASLPPLLELYPSDPAAQADAFKAWLRRTIFWDFHGSAGFFLQLKLNAGIICMLVALVLLIVLRRMHERSFWMIRFARKREGTIVIPNAVNCFTAMEGVYGIIAIALSVYAAPSSRNLAHLHLFLTAHSCGLTSLSTSTHHDASTCGSSFRGCR